MHNLSMTTLNVCSWRNVMTDSSHSIKPTEAELSLLNILWQVGPATVRQIHDLVSKKQKTGYTTVLKILQIMHEKSLVVRDEANRAHVYAAANSETHTQSSLLQDLVSKAFGGSTSKLVMRAIDNSTSLDEINDIRQLLNDLESQK